MEALIDQTVAGAVLMIFGKATMVVAAIAVFARWFEEDAPVSPSESLPQSSSR